MDNANLELAAPAAADDGSSAAAIKVARALAGGMAAADNYIATESDGIYTDCCLSPADTRQLLHRTLQLGINLFNDLAEGEPRASLKHTGLDAAQLFLKAVYFEIRDLPFEEALRRAGYRREAAQVLRIIERLQRRIDALRDLDYTADPADRHGGCPRMANRTTRRN